MSTPVMANGVSEQGAGERDADRVVSPPRDQLARLRPPLEPGERQVFDFFDRLLAPEWEIYVQPHLNGLRPDFLLLNPNVGIAVFEVKDWDLDACDWRIEPSSGRPRLVGKDKNGRRFAEPSPFDRLHAYRTEVAELYCPALNRRAGIAAVSAGLIFPFAREDQLIERFESGLTSTSGASIRRYMTLASGDAIRNGDLDRVFPDHARVGTRLMDEDVANDLRHWLVEPDFAAEQRQPPPLSRDQLRYISTRTESGFRRLRGPAGSGKTLVVAGRGSALVEEGKDVLVVSYNVTLLNYLRDFAVRFGSTRNRITWLHFHGWCKRALYEAGLEDAYRALPWRTDNEDVLQTRLPALTEESIEKHRDRIDHYDAILVDEGQDFRPNWWEALRKVLRADGEMLLVADRAQDLYGRNELWTERAMEGAGFRGPWATLDVSYRMPGRLAALTADYVSRFLEDTEISPPIADDQQQLALDQTILRWIQTDEERLRDACFEAIRTSLTAERGNGRPSASFADLVFLCDRKDVGRSVVSRLEGSGVRTIHTYSSDPNLERRQKLYFFKDDARVKATTIHSFKGWEGRHLVVAAGGGSGQRALSAIYAALTRLKAHPEGSRLTVVCASPQLEAFGSTWPEFISLRA